MWALGVCEQSWHEESNPHVRRGRRELVDLHHAQSGRVVDRRRVVRSQAHGAHSSKSALGTECIGACREHCVWLCRRPSPRGEARRLREGRSRLCARPGPALPVHTGARTRGYECHYVKQGWSAVWRRRCVGTAAASMSSSVATEASVASTSAAPSDAATSETRPVPAPISTTRRPASGRRERASAALLAPGHSTPPHLHHINTCSDQRVHRALRA